MHLICLVCCGGGTRFICAFAEHVDLRDEATKGNWPVFLRLSEILLQMNETVFSPDRGVAEQKAACEQATKGYKGYWGPWLK